MKKIPVIVWLPLVFVAGGLVGYYGPAEELRSRDAREQEEKAKPKSKNAFGSFTELVNIPEVAKRPRRVKDQGATMGSDPSVSPAGSDPAGCPNLVVHCGGCMLTRREVLRRIDCAKEAGVPIVNYGILLAAASGMTDVSESGIVSTST